MNTKMNAELAYAAAILENEGFRVWVTPSKKSFRVNAPCNLVRYILQGLGYTVDFNTSFAKGLGDEFATLVK